jgi:hypothetical protein
MEPRKKSHKKAKVPKEKVIEQHVAKNKRKREVNKADRERERKEYHQSSARKSRSRCQTGQGRGHVAYNNVSPRCLW